MYLRRSVLVAVLWWRLRVRAPSAVASLCFVLFSFLKKKIYLTLAWRGEREMAEQKKVGSASGKGGGCGSLRIPVGGWW